MWSLPVVAPACEPFDWASLLEEAEARVAEERCRGDVAELRCEGLRRVERDACSRAHSLERQLDTCRFKLKEAVPKSVSRSVKALERRVESQDAEIADLRLTLRRSDERRERIEERHQHERLAETGHRPGTLADCEGVPRGRPRGCANAMIGCGRRSCGPRG